MTTNSVKSYSGMNINANSFVPTVEAQNEVIRQNKKIEQENFMFDQLEKIWWNQNKNMFEETISQTYAGILKVK